MKVAPAQAKEQEMKEQAAVNGIEDIEFDDVCHMAAEICHSPIALISVIDSGRQWFRSRHPLITLGLSADFAFCNQAMHHPREIFIISDLLKDHRFDNHLLVTSVPYAAFYCGVPLVAPDDKVLGMICIWDNKPRELHTTQVAALQSLGRQTAAKMTLQRQLEEAKQKNAELKAAYSDLESFATIAAHDLKSPLNAIVSLTDLLKTTYADKLDEEGLDYIDFLHASSQNLSELVTSVFNYSRATQLIAEQQDTFNFSALVRHVISLFKIPQGVSISYDENEQIIRTNKTVLQQVLTSLLDNAIKFAGIENTEISISLSETAGSYSVQVSDNGRGIRPELREKIFDLFKNIPGKAGSESMGIGLAIARTLLRKLGGNIAVTSAPSEGATFVVTLPK